jgi:4'-phosphopantetheinyl transferase
VLKLRPSDVHVWCRKTSDLRVDASRAADQYLSTEERVRRDRLHSPADRRDFAIAHDLVRRTLSYYADIRPADWVFTANAYGKPSIDNSEAHLAAISFSLSHTTGCVGCGVTLGKALGIDIECGNRPLSVQEIADRHFSNVETAWLRRHPDETRGIAFTELWTLKEAFLKAVGVGLSGSLAAASFRFEEPGQILFEPPLGVEHAAWHFALFDLGSSFRLAIAVAGREEPQFAVREGTSSTAGLNLIRISGRARAAEVYLS